LETMENIKSCGVMWYIGCHHFILEMFHIFFYVVIESHPRNVITSMQSIMTLMLDESDDISEQLVAIIQSSLGGGKMGVS
jgi:sister-chromatid-cohesion protein PDS5